MKRISRFCERLIDQFPGDPIKSQPGGTTNLVTFAEDVRRD